MKQQKRKRIIFTVMAVLLLAMAAFNIYVSDYYHAGEKATAILTTDDILNQEEGWIELEADMTELATDKVESEAAGIVLNGEENNLEADSPIGFIFYPGAKVEYTAYLPLMKALQEEGVNCYLAEMPFHLAFFGMNKAEEIIAANPDVETWYIGGHSLGGAFASSYAAKNKEKIDGIVLLGAYLYGDYPVEQTITIYGSEDLVLNRDKITYEENVYELEGGNHAQFGDYGEQEGDGIAAIGNDEQLEQTRELVMNFLSSK